MEEAEGEKEGVTNREESIILPSSRYVRSIEIIGSSLFLGYYRYGVQVSELIAHRRLFPIVRTRVPDVERTRILRY